ncbi:MAG: hypothetical protein QN162_14635 [Armatimonadota bacterium]|nr:hypothetical protein [Armatimonadota bacterium]MDR7534555.1 hypothetical protein [Armatimonadota bacterium]
MPESDFDRIWRLIAPLRARLPVYARGMVDRFITEDAIRALYREVGEAGIREAMEALIRVGRGGPLHAIP